MKLHPCMLSGLTLTDPGPFSDAVLFPGRKLVVGAVTSRHAYRVVATQAISAVPTSAWRRLAAARGRVTSSGFIMRHCPAAGVERGTPSLAGNG
jgi:hypothetical protein